jgi:GT2 family glycosyltransferase
VGGARRAASTGLSAVLLNRGGRYPRKTLFQELGKAGFDYILSIEGPQRRYDLEDLSGRFPSVRFILLKENVTAGEAVNMAAVELSSPFFFVLWNDHRLFDGITAAKMAALFGGKRLCTVPVVQNSRFETLHTLSAPVFYRGSIKALPEAPERENQFALFPYDWVGLYDRERFLRLGGFDREIVHAHWQLMDFGFRSCLWGEEIRSTQMIRLIHDGASPLTDNTAEHSYRLFYLKNLAPVFRLDHAHLPLRSFPEYLVKTGWDLLTAGFEFFRERRWVRENRRRFRRDARGITDLWEHGESP